MKKFICIFIFMLLMSCAESDKSYPSKNITLVVPYSPGGASDTAARIYAQLLEHKLNVPVIVENRTGGAGAIGLSYVQNSKPDGYTIAYMPVESVMLESLGHVQMKPSDFQFIGGGTIVPSALTVSSSSPWTNYEQFITYAKNNPNKVRVGNSGPGSIWHLAASALGDAEGVQFTHVPFEGGATAVAALLGNHIEAVTVSESEVEAGVADGSLRVLASMRKDRGELPQNVPVLNEMGKDLSMIGWGAFAVPAGTPKEVLEVLMPASEAVLQSDDFKNQVTGRGLIHGYQNSKDMQEFAQDQYEFFIPLIKNLNN
ncbi:MAG: hypothetical protein ATN35_00100 [Epulopiscium sp. Nele67-Bin004]|nr:MAG: hypothetical protein ATN35_00100 [Epulopiscium sp. Nele67-Bin004]